MTILLGILSTSLALAQSECKVLKTSNDLLKCVIQNHAEIKIGESLIEETKLGIDVALQQPNPEFDMEVLDSTDGGFGTEFTLMHTFERGNKKEARRKIASLEHMLSKTVLMNKKDKIILSTVLSLYRIRQIDHDLEINKEIIETFKKIIFQYTNAGSLGPEQKVSISVFNLALEENRLNRTSLLSEREGLVSQLQNNLGKEIEITPSLLPKVRRIWKSIKELSQKDNNQVKLAQERIDLARAQLLLEEAKAISNISLGPKISFENDKNRSYSVGIALSMPLPIYHQNNAGRTMAMAAIKTNETRLDVLKSQLKKRLQYLENVYEETRKMNVKILSNKEIEINHKNLHKMIERGVVSAPIVIELHRQILEFYNKLHEQELKGINALWQIYTINGTVQSEELQ